MRTFLRFLSTALHYKGRLIIGAIGVLGVNLLQFAQLGTVIPFVDIIVTGKKLELPAQYMPYLPQPLLDPLTRLVAQVNAADRVRLLGAIAIFLFVAVVLKGIFDFAMKVSMESVAQSVMRDFMTRMYEHLQTLPVEFFAKTRTGELISRVTNDVHIVQASLSARFVDSISEVMKLPFFIGFCLFIDWKTTLLAGIALPLLMGPIVEIGRRLRKISKKTQEKIADITAMLAETINGIRIVRAFNMEDYEIGRFRKQADRFCYLRVKAVRREALVSPMTEAVGVACLLLVAYRLVMPVMRGEAQWGMVAAYCGSLLISIKPFRSVGKVNSLIQRSMAAIERIYKLLETEPAIKEMPGAVELAPLQHEIRFNNVSFEYESAEGPVITDFNLSVKAGEMVAIVGPSGGGKTTLANLIPRFYEVTKGAILFDGVDIREATFASLRGQIGIVTQDTVLFNDTVRNNIAYGRADIPLEQVVEAAQAANADGFVRELPQGYDTIIGEQGVRLSGGQRQRLAIARAILKNPRVLILDEATSALDTESERLVQEAIDRLIKNRTVIAIAHRLSTIHHADAILVLVDGHMVQIGTHDSLIADDDGVYKKLHDLQFHDMPDSVPSGIVDFIKYKFRQARERHAQKPRSDAPQRARV